MTFDAEFFGFRNMLIEQAIEDCISAIKRGETDIMLDGSEFTEAEIEHIKQEVARRLG